MCQNELMKKDKNLDDRAALIESNNQSNILLINASSNL